MGVGKSVWVPLHFLYIQRGFRETRLCTAYGDISKIHVNESIRHGAVSPYSLARSHSRSNPCRWFELQENLR